MKKNTSVMNADMGKLAIRAQNPLVTRINEGKRQLQIMSAPVTAAALQISSLKRTRMGSSIATSRLYGVPAKLMIISTAIASTETIMSKLMDASKAGGTAEIDNVLTSTLPRVIFGTMNLSESQIRPIDATNVDIKTSS
ncbi:MAG TPA: hypothetical protein PKA48_09365 [Candidatus Obscuribacter sp.]|nr:hypothetical protein [Candidatus Obscuribacter sp.]